MKHCATARFLLTGFDRPSHGVPNPTCRQWTLPLSNTINAIDEHGLKARICRFRPIWGTNCLPDDLRKLGYLVTDAGEGERILYSAITEQFTLRADGELEPLGEGSTKPIASTVTHAGICKVKRYGFGMP
jgi:hypothetical protein